jgi:hypothetical protein
MIEHYLYGTRSRVKALRAALTDDMTIRDISDGLVLRVELGAEDDLDEAIARIEALAQAHGVEYDGHGEWLGEDPEDGGTGLDIQSLRFTKRTGIKPGHGFAFDLPDGRFGHAIYLGSDRIGYVLLEISTLVTDQPASPDALRAPPTRYRQPILVWHRPFAVRSLAQSVPLVALPVEVAFRSSMGWPEPEDVAEIEQRFGASGTDTPEGWTTLLLAMAKAAERLPGLEGYEIWMARVSRAGVLKLPQPQDHTLHRFEQGRDVPMSWQPSDMDEIMTSLMGGTDMIAIRDQVT